MTKKKKRKKKKKQQEKKINKYLKLIRIKPTMCNGKTNPQHKNIHKVRKTFLSLNMHLANKSLLTKKTASKTVTY